MITVPPAVQVTLGNLSNTELKDGLTDALQTAAYAIWEAKRRGFTVQSSGLERPSGTLNADQAVEFTLSATRVVHL